MQKSYPWMLTNKEAVEASVPQYTVGITYLMHSITWFVFENWRPEPGTRTAEVYYESDQNDWLEDYLYHCSSGKETGNVDINMELTLNILHYSN